MQLQDILYSQGFGTRRICAGLIQQGYVQVDVGEGLVTCDDALEDIDVHEGLQYSVQGVVWPYHAKAYVLLHKPAGYECSHKPSAWPSMYTLLPPPLRYRPQKSAVQGVQAVGRLDQDTTGMLVLTDDGPLIHRMSSPRHHVPKVYEVGCKHPVDASQIERLLAGVVLAGAVQDMLVLTASTRRDGRSLGDMIRSELGPFAGTVTGIGILAIMIILLAVLGLVVVKALAHSPWAWKRRW